ncbi:hypothetical protein MJN76_33370, partial [Salmonella enterica subsp. enterica serovar Anatum]|nr:hypothetical protein [Salmonella enterica subsp. enterica serovar Anatum]
FRLFKIPMVRKDDITSDDIYAVVEAGALAGVLRKQEHELIENGEKSVPLADVQPGMLLRLTTGDRVPVDGEITQGEAWLDEAML